MSNKKESTGKSGGITTGGLLQVALIVLKLCEVIDWSWWWVFVPSWISLGICVICIVLAVICGWISERL